MYTEAKKPNTPEKASGKLSPRQTALFCEQLTLLLRAGISLGDGMNSLREECAPGSAELAMYSVVCNTLSEAGTLHSALEASGCFPDYMLHMIKIGEHTGKLDDVTDELALYYSRQDSLASQIRSAVLYPLALICMMAVVMGVLVIKVLPVFGDVIRGLGGGLDALSLPFINIGTTVGKLTFVLLVAIIAVVSVILIVAKQSGCNFIYHLPVFRGISTKLSAGRFASVMSMMLAGGFGVEEALGMTESVIDNAHLRDKVASCRALVENGSDFASAVTETGIFPPLYARMISVGCRTGCSESVMKKLAEIYDSETEDSLARAVSIIEPTLAAFLAIIIGVILISVMMPLMGVMSSMG